MLMQPALNTHIFARDFAQLKLVGATSLTQIRIAFSNSQIAGALFCVALRLASAAGKSILAVAATVAKLFTEILRANTGAIGVTGPSMVAGRVVKNVIRAGILFQLDFTTMNRPKAVFFLISPWRRGVVFAQLNLQNVSGLFLGEMVDLLTGFVHHGLCNGAIVVEENLMD